MILYIHINKYTQFSFICLLYVQYFLVNRVSLGGGVKYNLCCFILLILLTLINLISMNNVIYVPFYYLALCLSDVLEVRQHDNKSTH